MRDREEILTKLDPIAWPHGVQSTVGRESRNRVSFTGSQVIPGTSQQRLQGLLTTIDWDEDDRNGQRVQDMLRLPSAGDGVLIFDATGFAKQGKCSVGVARQDSGTLGKTGNSQVMVNCHYAERTIAWPVATRLYLPKDWASDADRRTKAKVPEELAFRAKPQIALELLDQAKAWGVRWACVTADADYGDNPNFLDGLEQRRQPHVVAVRADFAVALSRRGGPMSWSRPKRRGRGARWLGGRGARAGCAADSSRCAADGRRRRGGVVRAG